MKLVEIARDLGQAVDKLTFSAPVTHVYNPLVYAWEAHREYLEEWGAKEGRIIMIGMNPGPWGMAQTGVPFGEVDLVQNWIGICQGVNPPEHAHPQRPIEGFQCKRREVSGARLWGWAKSRFGTPENFFARFFVYNYCPLSFMEESGRNRTPDKLKAAEKKKLFALCDKSLARFARAIRPRLVLGIGVFAEQRAREALKEDEIPVGRLLHPSPANPQANRGWAEVIEAQLKDLGVSWEPAQDGD